MQPLDNERLEQSNVRRCKSTCRLELEFGVGTADSAVGFNWTLDR